MHNLERKQMMERESAAVERLNSMLGKPSSSTASCYESLEMRMAEVKQNWLQLVANADDQSPCDVVVARGDYEVMMSLICGDS